MHTDRQEIVDWSSRLSAAGDWERYAASPWEALIEIVFANT